MDKPKIPGVKSTSYQGGRIDEFPIRLNEELLQGPIMSLFKELGFSNEDINDLDMVYQNSQGYYFFYTSTIKVHIFIDKEYVNLVFDTTIKKEKLFGIVEKYFQIF